MKLILLILASLLGAWPCMAIIGGEVVPAGTYPYIVSVRRQQISKMKIPFVGMDLTRSREHCTGVLIARNLVLTAASCVSANRRRESLIALNTTIQEPDRKYGNVFPLKEYYFPRRWNARGYGHNVAIFEFDGDHNITQFAQLPVRGQAPRIGENVTALGLGLETWKLTKDVSLRQLTLPIMDVDKCRNLMAPLQPIESDKFCGTPCMNTDVRHGTCEGDWGGPVLVNDTVVGLISQGPTCFKFMRPCYPSVFTLVSDHLAFIESVMTRHEEALWADKDKSSFTRGPSKTEGFNCCYN